LAKDEQQVSKSEGNSHLRMFGTSMLPD
jgi:hypothetical protein